MNPLSYVNYSHWFLKYNLNVLCTNIIKQTQTHKITFNLGFLLDSVMVTLW